MIKGHVVSRSKDFKKGEKCEPLSSCGQTEPECLFKYCTLKKTSANKQRVKSTYTFAGRQRNKTQPQTLLSQEEVMRSYTQESPTAFHPTCQLSKIRPSVTESTIKALVLQAVRRNINNPIKTPPKLHLSLIDWDSVFEDDLQPR